MVEELLAARRIELTYGTVRRWSVKFGLGIARRIRTIAMARGDRWHLDEVVVTINGKKHWLWRAVDQRGAVSMCWCKVGATGTQPGNSWVRCSGSTTSLRVY